MSRGCDPADVATQADLARAMAAVRAATGKSLGEIVNSPRLPAAARISKTTASNVETVGRSLPKVDSLRAFLAACGVADDRIDEWCDALGRLRSGAPPPRPRRVSEPVAEPVTEPDDDLWRDLFTLPLVQRMTEPALAADFPRLRGLVDHVVVTLRMPYETAPAYTLHGVPHAVAVVRRLGELLGGDVRRLGPLEVRLLIVAAFLHDVGRTPAAGEISPARLARFLDRHTPEPDGAPVVEDYCRWDRHHRLHEYLKRLPGTLLHWDGVPVREALGAVCEPGTGPRAVPGADLAFCAGLLRLASRLELCGLRFADDIHRRLGIDRRTTPRTGPDDLEWTAHVRNLALVPHRRADDYDVVAEAVVLRPVAEFDLREALDALDAEFLRCRAARGSWTGWRRDLPLPETVDRSGVQGIGYTYEKLTFELAREDVLDLFVGDRLYGNHHAFVRELLQNSLDAVRLRAVLDPDAGGGTVAVSCWEDDGSVWFRVDDDGVGMDLHTIREYFLRIGRSYYNSDELDRELRRFRRRGARFGAISRFGIGIMSCFMLGDRIEVSTRRYTPGGGEGPALRLSVSRREDFAVLRVEGEGDDPMPARPGDPAVDFRETCGTSLAVHIDGASHSVLPGSLLANAAYFHFTADCAMTLNGVPHPGIDLDRPLVEPAVSVREHTLRGYSTAMDPARLGPVSVYAVALDLSAASPDPRVRGQLVAIAAVPPGPARRPLLDLWPPQVVARLHPTVRDLLEPVGVTLSATADRSTVRLRCDVDGAIEGVLQRFGLARGPDEPDDRYFAVQDSLAGYGVPDHGPADVQVLMDVLSGTVFGASYEGPALTRELPDPHWWSHNGITLPVRRRTESIDDRDGLGEIRYSKVSLADPEPVAGGLTVEGNVGFLDELRPDLSLARDAVQSVPFAMTAALTLAIRRAVPPGLPPAVAAAFAEAGAEAPWLGPHEVVDLGTVLDAAGDDWSSEALLSVDGRMCTLDEVVALARDHEVDLELPRKPVFGLDVDFTEPPWNGMHLDFARQPIGAGSRVPDLVGRALAQQRFELRWTPVTGPGPRDPVLLRCHREWTCPDGLRYFPPLHFVGYGSADEVRIEGRPWNLDHPVCRWLVEVAPELDRRAPGHFARIREAFRHAETAVRMNAYLETLERQGVVEPEVLYAADDDDGESLTAIALVLIRHAVTRVVTAVPRLAPPAEVRRGFEEAASTGHLSRS